jgi:hypothetical protein
MTGQNATKILSVPARHWISEVIDATEEARSFESGATDWILML